MKAKAKKHFINIQVWTTHFLGTAERGQALLTLLESIDGGRWAPERWNTIEPIRKPYSRDSAGEIIKCWIEDRPPGSGEVYNDLMFRRTKSRALILVHALRLGTGGLNSIWMELEAQSFLTGDGSDRLKAILQGFVSWSDGVYGSVYYSGQAHKRTVQMTPLQRLDQAYWLNFFGQPYLDMFGRERILRAPCHAVVEIPGHGLVLQAAPRFDSPEITESDKLLIALEEYLGPDAFAGRGYPKVPCQVPSFDLWETIPPSPRVYSQ